MATSSAQHLPPPAEAEESSFRLGNLEVRPNELEVLAGGHRVGFTVREFQTFLALALRPDRVVHGSEIYSNVWGGKMAYRDRSVDVFVRKIRQKLERAAPEWRYVHTHFGIGYRFAPERNGHAWLEHVAD